MMQHQTLDKALEAKQIGENKGLLRLMTGHGAWGIGSKQLKSLNVCGFISAIHLLAF